MENYLGSPSGIPLAEIFVEDALLRCVDGGYLSGTIIVAIVYLTASTLQPQPKAGDVRRFQMGVGVREEYSCSQLSLKSQLDAPVTWTRKSRKNVSNENPRLTLCMDARYALIYNVKIQSPE